MPRSVEEWIGKSDDAMPPPRVRLRIFDRYQGRCYRSGIKIRPGDKWALDHVIALTNGGENRESNLAPILADAHKEKTRADVREKAKVYAKRAAHLGLHKSKQKIQSRGFAKPPRQNKASSPINKWRGF